jgi:hypothetical protein
LCRNDALFASFGEVRRGSARFGSARFAAVSTVNTVGSARFGAVRCGATYAVSPTTSRIPPTPPNRTRNDRKSAQATQTSRIPPTPRMPWPAGLRELTAAAGRRRPTHLFYSNFDWLGLLFGRQQYQPTPRSSTYLPTYLPTTTLPKLVFFFSPHAGRPEGQVLSQHALAAGLRELIRRRRRPPPPPPSDTFILILIG